MTGSIEAAQNAHAATMFALQKAMNTSRQQGAAAVQLLEAAADLAKGNGPASLGDHRVDVRA